MGITRLRMLIIEHTKMLMNLHFFETNNQHYEHYTINDFR